MHTLQVLTYPSVALEADIPIAVLVPPDYAISGRRYAVLTLLHGLSDTFLCWLDNTALRRYLDDLRLIVVMPECGRSFYINTVDGRHYEDFLTYELMTFVDHQYPTLATRESRALGGMSMGGYGALLQALRHRDMWGAAFSHSGALGAPRWVEDPPGIGIFGPMGSPTRQQHDLWTLIHKPGPLPHMFFDCGMEDFLLDENTAFHRLLDVHAIPHTFRVRPGGHSWRYCDENLASGLSWLCRVLEGDCDPELEGMTIIDDVSLELNS